MKRITSFTLVITLLLGLCLQINASGIEEVQLQPLPEVGQVISGFRVEETGFMEIINAKTVLFEHEKTGAKLFYIQSKDIDRSFQIAFKTPAVDNTGVNHVLEHITVSGSEKYPMENVMFTIANQTYCTFINAFTTATSTIFPVSSMSEEQLFRLAEVYLDCVYNPSVYTDKNIFLREAWRYEMADADSPLEINGTVYNEMKGALGSISSAAIYNVLDALYPKSNQANIAGGDPVKIPDLSYEQLIQTHKKYYHPSNSLMILYGNLDYTRFLKMIDEEYLKDFDKIEIDIDFGKVEPFKKRIEKTYKFPASANLNISNTAQIDYAFSLTDVSEEDLIGLSILVSVLNQESSPIKKAFAENQIGGRMIVRLDESIPQPILIFTAENADGSKKNDFMALIDNSISSLIENGYDKDLINATISSVLLGISNITELSNLGVNISMSTAMMWANRGEINYFSDFIKNITAVSEKVDDNYFEDLTSKYIKNNNHAALVATIPEPGLAEKLEEQQKEYLARLKSLIGPQGIEKIVKDTVSYNEWNDSETDQSVVEKLQAVKVKDLPVEMKAYEIIEKKLDDGVRMLSAVADVAETGYTILLFDISAVPVEKLHYLPLLVNLLGELDTEQYTREQLNTLNIRYLNGANIDISTILKEDRDIFTPFLSITWMGLMGEYAEQIGLVNEILLNTKFEDADTVLNIVKQQISNFRNAFSNNPVSLMVSRNTACFDACSNYQNYIEGLDYYNFLLQLEQIMQAQPDIVLNELNSIRKMIVNRTNLISLFAGSEKNIEKYESEVKKLIANLPVNPINKQDYSGIPAPSRREGIVVGTPVQYNMICADYKSMGIEFSGKFIPAGLFIYDNYITPKIRFGYGAYDNLVNFSPSYFIMISYRDPNIRETFEVYLGLPEFLRNINITQEELDRYILKAFGSYSAPMGELGGAVSKMTNYLAGKTDEYWIELLQEIKSVTVEDVKNTADMFEALFENGAWISVGSEEMIKTNLDLYDSYISFLQQEEQQPDEPVTREQFITLILGDVPNPMEVAKQSGLIQGDGTGNYFEDKIISREEIAVILDRIILLSGIQLQGEEVTIADEGDISPWALDSVRKMVSSGIIKLDSDGNFRPKDDATESFIITILSEFINILSQ